MEKGERESILWKARGNLPLADQDILNVVGGQTPYLLQPLPCEWNYHTWQVENISGNMIGKISKPYALVPTWPNWTRASCSNAIWRKSLPRCSPTWHRSPSWQLSGCDSLSIPFHICCNLTSVFGFKGICRRRCSSHSRFQVLGWTGFSISKGKSWWSELMIFLQRRSNIGNLNKTWLSWKAG